jgi:uncharacterized protein (TIGR00369 family)
VSMFTAKDPDFAARIARSFHKQGAMHLIGATLSHVAPGEVDIALPVDTKICQQHGFVHAGIVSTIADSAAGFASLTLLPAGSGILTAEFKINLLAPAAGDRLVARGRVIKAGRTLTVAQAEVFAVLGEQEKLVALLIATLMGIEGRAGVAD